MSIYKSMEQLIGNTPLIECSRFNGRMAGGCTVLAKMESFNPAGSVKDRVALHMIEKAEKDGTLSPGGTIIEPTSGNTGIGLAAICAIKGYRLIITMPDTMSVERQKLMKAYGAELIMTEGCLGMMGAVEKAEELKAEIPGSIIAGQFVNPANPEAHYLSTGPEIWKDTEGNVDILVAGVGTGGTITGTGKYLKEKNPDIKIVAVEPEASPVLAGGKAGPHEIQGIGANFVPAILDLSLVDEIIEVPNGKSFEYAREFAKDEGLLVGISSGAALYAAVEVATRPENRGKRIVVILPDTGDHYLSTELFK